MKHYELYTQVDGSPGAREYTYWVQISDGSVWKVLRGNLYRWYSWRFKSVHKIVGAVAEWIHPPRFSEPFSTRDFPYQAREDLRDYEWNNHPVVCRLQITYEEYLALGGQ